MAFLAYLLPAVLPLPFLIRRSSIATYYFKLALYLSSLGLCSVWGLFLSIVLAPSSLSYSVNFLTARSFYYLTSPLTGIRFSVEGEEHLQATHPAVLVGSHQSMLDILYLGRIFPRRCTILAKRSLKFSPLLGQYMTLTNALFIDRSDPASAIVSLSAAGQDMKKKDLSLWIFPEGTRTLKEENTLRQFKRGAFHLAIEAGLPIIPVVCENYWRLYRKGIFQDGDLKIKVLPPIETTSLTAADVPALTKSTHDAMETALREISRPSSSSSDPSSAPTSSPSSSSAAAPFIPPPLFPDSSPAAQAAESSVTSTLKAVTTPEPAQAPQAPIPEVAQPAPDKPESVASFTSESWSTDTEDDEENGAVLVGRPRGSG